MEKYIPTGNERVSLPTIRESDGGIESISFLSMTLKGMLELRGNAESALMQPFLQAEDAHGTFHDIPLSDISWSREEYWIPDMRAKADNISLAVTYLAPVDERGFGIRLHIKGICAETLRFGVRGVWGGAWHCVNEEKKIEGSMHCYRSSWSNCPVFDLRCGSPLFAFAPLADREIDHSFQHSKDGIHYTLSISCQLISEKSESLTIWWGFGFEEVAAATSAREMLRRTWEWESARTRAWLQKRSSTIKSESITKIYNTNLFFCIFFSTGITLDTEETVCITSRSSRYYVSAAFWDRDTLLWAFPAILDADRKLAKRIILYVFERQRRNIGIHSRYIDGTVLEPGFELDELVAPVIALVTYIQATGDSSLLSEGQIQLGIASVLEKLEEVRHPEAALYETFLQPTDDERVYPFLTYDNVLVWLALSGLGQLDPIKFGYCKELADQVRAAVLQHCVFWGSDGRRYFGWSTDLKGHHDIYDEPPGSLQLLPYYGFCDKENEIWQNTVSNIRSPEYAYSFAGMPIAEIGCPHAPYPWVLSICNSLLSGHAEQAWAELEKLDMDNGIACESVDPVTGSCMTGAAFATCAGFLCHSILAASGEAHYA